MNLLPIHTSRLVLRRFTCEDLEAFQAYRSDPILALYQEWEPMPDEEARSFLAGQAERTLGIPRQWLQVAVTLSETGEIIGDLGLCAVAGNEGVVEIGFTVARAAQGRGYATEAVAAILDALLTRMQVRSVVAVTDARNAASVALLRRVGFEHESTATTIFRGETCEEHRFVLSKTQWTRGV